MNILQIGTTDTKGGAAQVSWTLKTELEKYGHTVSMVVGYKRSSDSRVQEIFDTPFNRFVSKIIHRNFSARLKNKLAYLASNDISFLPGKRIFGLDAYKKADIVHAHNLHGNFFSIKHLPEISHAKPLVWTLHDMWAITGHNSHAFDCVHWQTGGCSCILPDTLPAHKKNNSQKLWEIKKEIYSKSKLHIVVPSRWLYERVKKSILKEHDTTLIYNGIDTDIFQRTEKNLARNILRLPHDKTLVLFASKGGKKNIWKGWEFAEKLIEKNKNNTSLLFLCVGGYENPSKLQNVFSIPYVADKKNLAQYYSACDMLLYPSLADNCPLTVLEAMACGLGALTFQTGGIPEIVQHLRSGYVAQYKNFSDLEKGFTFMLNLTETAKIRLSETNQKIIANSFTSKIMTEQYLQLYSSLIHR